LGGSFSGLVALLSTEMLERGIEGGGIVPGRRALKWSTPMARFAAVLRAGFAESSPRQM
jgi:hypothetical protein